MFTYMSTTGGLAPLSGTAWGSYTVLSASTVNNPGFIVQGMFLRPIRWRASRAPGSNRFTRNWSLPGDRKVPMPMVAPVRPRPQIYLQTVKRATLF